MMKRSFLLISVLFMFFVNSCSTLLGEPMAAPVDTAASTMEATITRPTADAHWPTVVPPSADFDYYVLALSWAPDYCSANPDDSQECSLGRKYGFVLHGLWPQYNSGYPSDCSNAPLPPSAKVQFPYLYPNDKLLEHEWSKHGTCSGLSASAYLDLASKLKERVQIPAAYVAPSSPFRTTTDDLKKNFLQANPLLTEASLAVNCSGSGRFLSELDVCISKDGRPAACGADVRKSALKSCSNADFLVRNVK